MSTVFRQRLFFPAVAPSHSLRLAVFPPLLIFPINLLASARCFPFSSIRIFTTIWNGLLTHKYTKKYIKHLIPTIRYPQLPLFIHIFQHGHPQLILAFPPIEIYQPRLKRRPA
jgi:hypothetical protein